MSIESEPLFIGGAAVEAQAHFEVRDPAAPDRIVGLAPSASEAQVVEAVECAARAWKSWSAETPEARAAMLVDALSALDEDYERRVELLVRENGKIRAEAEVELGVFSWRCELATSLAGVLSEVRHLDAMAFRPEPNLVEAGQRATVRRYVAPPLRSQVMRMSMGVVTIIVPYNWPIAILAASLPYALIAGNTVIVKPPPTAPLCLIQTIRLLGGRLPKGVVNVVCGSNEAVAPSIRHPLVRKVVFTGSTPAGKSILCLAAENMARVTLELGGNDPAIVLDDAKLDEQDIRRLVMGAFLTSGQVCMGIKRVYVHRSRFHELVAKMCEVLDRYVVGDGLAPDTTMGPLNNTRQREIVAALCGEARQLGVETRECGSFSESARNSGGYFLPPTLVLDPPRRSRIVQEEQFGPALPICTWDNLDEIIDELNEEWAGLCSSVWTRDESRAEQVAVRLRTGTTWVNNANAVAQDDRAPFGGFRMSGIGRELGIEGLLDFTELHTVTYPASR